MPKPTPKPLVYYEVWDPREGKRVDVSRSFQASSPEGAARSYAYHVADIGEGSPWDGKLSVRNEETGKVTKVQVTFAYPEPQVELSVRVLSTRQSEK